MVFERRSSRNSLAQVIPLEELGRPRIDVVVNCSGVFRDLFVNQMILLDRAVKLASEQDEPLEMNYVRKHAIEQVMHTPRTLPTLVTHPCAPCHFLQQVAWPRSRPSIQAWDLAVWAHE